MVTSAQQVTTVLKGLQYQFLASLALTEAQEVVKLPPIVRLVPLGLTVSTTVLQPM